MDTCKKLVAFFALACVVAGSILADEEFVSFFGYERRLMASNGKPSDCPDGYVYLATSDANAGTSGTGFDHSSMTAESTTGHWSDGLPPSAGKDYFIGGAALATPNNNNVAAGTTYRFAGRSLMLGKGGEIKHCSKKDSCSDFGENVTVQATSSAVYSFPAVGTGNPCTKATVTLKENAMLTFAAGVAGLNNYRLQWNVKSDFASAQVRIQNSHTAATPVWYWAGTTDGFKGAMTLATTTEANYMTFYVANVTLGCPLTVERFQHLAVSGASAFCRNVTLQPGAVIDVPSGSTFRVGTLVSGGEIDFGAGPGVGTLVVGEKMTCSGVTTIRLPAGQAPTTPLVTVPTSSPVTAADFAFDDPFTTGEFRDNGDGTKSLHFASGGGAGSRTAVVDHPMTIDPDALKGDGWRVSVLKGVEASLAISDKRIDVRSEKGSTLRLIRTGAAIERLASVWMDASAANTVSNLTIVFEDSYACYDGSGPFLKTGLTVSNENGDPYVIGWFDRRPAYQGVKMWNSRYDTLYNGHHNSMHGTHPALVRGGLNGLNYVTCGPNAGSRKAHYVYEDGSEKSPDFPNMTRLYFTKGSSAGTVQKDAVQKPRYAFLVFGAQNGGGRAIFASPQLDRGGTTLNCPITTDTTVGIGAWIDGSPVNANAQNTLKGGWQVLTLDLKNAVSLSAFGFCTNPSSTGECGGQNYAEIILVDTELTEQERQAVEIYLAEKWGLQGQYVYPRWARESSANVYGSGTLDVASGYVTLRGAFSGRINLNGNNITIGSTNLPPTASDIDTNGLEGWYDPDLADKTREQDVSVTYTPTNGSPKFSIEQLPNPRMIYLWDRLRAWKTGDYVVYGQPQRAPHLDRSARAFGPARRWMEFVNHQEPLADPAAVGGAINGKVLRFSKITNATTGDGDGSTQQQPMQTLIMVQDSTRGGGQPFADGTTVNNPVLYKSRTGAKAAAGQPIYPAGSDGILTKGITCIDGLEVDGLVDSFGQRPEVLTVVPTNTFNIAAFAQLGNSENLKDRGESIGEILVYNRRLDEPERKIVEAYLSYKWLGLLSGDYGSFVEAQVSGAGTVTSTRQACLPKFSDDFTGTVYLTDVKTLSFVLGTEGGWTSALNPLNLGGGTLGVSGDITVSIASNGSRLLPGTYKLVTWGRQPAGVTWKFTLEAALKDAKCDYGVTDEGIWFKIGAKRSIITFR